MLLAEQQQDLEDPCPRRLNQKITINDSGNRRRIVKEVVTEFPLGFTEICKEGDGGKNE